MLLAVVGNGYIPLSPATGHWSGSPGASSGSDAIGLVILAVIVLVISSINVVSQVRARRKYREAVSRLLDEVERARRDPLLIFQVRRKVGWPTRRATSRQRPSGSDTSAS